MDPVTLTLAFLMKNPQVVAGAASAAKTATAPGTVDVAKMQTSLADFSRGVLLCYHKTARFHTTDLVQTPWARQAQYAADSSAVVRIRYSGLSTTQYEMLVAVMAKGAKVRASVIADSALMPYSKKCQLEEWTGG